MHYCGNCGTQLDARALAAGRCPSCGVLVSPFGDPMSVAPPSVDMMARTQEAAHRPTVPDAPRDPPTSPVKWPREPNRPAVQRTRGTRLMMRIGGVLLLLVALALCCADIAILTTAGR